MIAGRSGGRASQEHLPPRRLEDPRRASTHYDMNLEQVATGYVVAPGVEGDDAVAAMEQADAAVKGFGATLSEWLDGDLLPDAEDKATEDARDAEGGL